MEKTNSPLNQSTHQAQTFWQVWVPLILGILIVIFMAVLTAMTGTANGEEGGRLAGVSLIILLTPTLFFCLIILSLLCLVIYGIFRLTSIVPFYSFKLLTYVVLASDFIRLWSDRIAQPVLIIREGLASFYRFLDVLSLKSKK